MSAIDGGKKPTQIIRQIHRSVLYALDRLSLDSPLIHYPGSKTFVEQSGLEQCGRKRTFRDETMAHPLSEIVFVARGEADMILENVAMPCPKGSFLVIPSQARHCAGRRSFWERPDVENCSSDTLWMIAYASGARLHYSFSRGEVNSVSTGIFVPDRHLIILMELLVDDTRNAKASGQGGVKNYLNLIYSRLAYSLREDSVIVESHGEELSAEETTRLRATPIERAISYIDRNFDGKISLDDVARAAYISRAQLTTVFRRERSQTVLAYITQRRLESAKFMLRYDGFGLEHVAKLSGFGNVAYMTRQFSRHVGMPPGEYRRLSDKTKL